MPDILHFMMLLIKSEACVCGAESDLNGNVPPKNAVDEEIYAFYSSRKQDFTDRFFEELYRLSKQFDLSHLVGAALSKTGLLPHGDIGAKFQKQTLLAVHRYEQMNYELNRICDALSGAKIDFIALKGAEMRKYYPEEWMRTSCDIDILVHKCDTERTVKCLTEKLEYRSDFKSQHDISIYSPSNIHIELHFSLTGNEFSESAEKLLCNIWSHAAPECDGSYKYVMDDEMFYFYHLAHAAKHIANGGCGIKPFLDLWILNHRVEHDKEKRNLLLNQGGLLQFAASAEKLSEIWFGGGGETESNLMKLLQEYILNGGSYGNTENKALVNQVLEKNGTVVGQHKKSAINLIFKPYDTLKYWYPSLEGRKWLLPFYQVKRWIRLITSGSLRSAVNMKKYSSSITCDTDEKTKQLLKELGLIE